MKQGIFILGVGAFALCGIVACSSDESGGGGAKNPDASGTGGSSSGGKAGSGGSSTGGKTGSGGGGAGGGSTGGASSVDGGDGGTTLAFTGKVVEATPGGLTGSTEPGLAGVSVCLAKADGTKDTSVACATTDSTGAFALHGLPKNKELIVTFSKAGYGTQAKPIDARGTTIAYGVNFRLAKTGADGGPGANFGTDPSVASVANTGLLNFFAVMPAARADGGVTGGGFDWAPGVTVTITPTKGNGPFYIDAQESFVASATSTTGTGYGGWFINLPAGEYQLTFSHPTLNCQAIAGNAFGYPGPAGSHIVRVPVIAGMNTQAVGVFCNPPPPKDAGRG